MGASGSYLKAKTDALRIHRRSGEDKEALDLQSQIQAQETDLEQLETALRSIKLILYNNSPFSLVLTDFKLSDGAAWLVSPPSKLQPGECSVFGALLKEHEGQDIDVPLTGQMSYDGMVITSSSRRKSRIGRKHKESDGKKHDGDNTATTGHSAHEAKVQPLRERQALKSQQKQQPTSSTHALDAPGLGQSDDERAKSDDEFLDESAASTRGSAATGDSLELPGDDISDDEVPSPTTQKESSKKKKKKRGTDDEKKSSRTKKRKSGSPSTGSNDTDENQSTGTADPAGDSTKPSGTKAGRRRSEGSKTHTPRTVSRGNSAQLSNTGLEQGHETQDPLTSASAPAHDSNPISTPPIPVSNVTTMGSRKTSNSSRQQSNLDNSDESETNVSPRSETSAGSGHHRHHHRHHHHHHPHRPRHLPSILTNMMKHPERHESASDEGDGEVSPPTSARSIQSQASDGSATMGPPSTRRADSVEAQLYNRDQPDSPRSAASSGASPSSSTHVTPSSSRVLSRKRSSHGLLGTPREREQPHFSVYWRIASDGSEFEDRSSVLSVAFNELIDDRDGHASLLLEIQERDSSDYAASPQSSSSATLPPLEESGADGEDSRVGEKATFVAQPRAEGQPDSSAHPAPASPLKSKPPMRPRRAMSAAYLRSAATLKKSDVERLEEQTYFDADEIRELHILFSKVAGYTSHITPETFSAFLPELSDPELRRAIFTAFDKSHDFDDRISFDEFTLSLSAMCRGTIEERARVTFDMCVGGKAGQSVSQTVNREQVLRIVTRIAESMSAAGFTPTDYGDPVQVVNNVFLKPGAQVAPGMGDRASPAAPPSSSAPPPGQQNPSTAAAAAAATDLSHPSAEKKRHMKNKLAVLAKVIAHPRRDERHFARGQALADNEERRDFNEEFEDTYDLDEDQEIVHIDHPNITDKAAEDKEALKRARRKSLGSLEESSDVDSGEQRDAEDASNPASDDDDDDEREHADDKKAKKKKKKHQQPDSDATTHDPATTPKKRNKLVGIFKKKDKKSSHQQASTTTATTSSRTEPSAIPPKPLDVPDMYASDDTTSDSTERRPNNSTAASTKAATTQLPPRDPSTDNDSDSELLTANSGSSESDSEGVPELDDHKDDEKIVVVKTPTVAAEDPPPTVPEPTLIHSDPVEPEPASPRKKKVSFDKTPTQDNVPSLVLPTPDDSTSPRTKHSPSSDTSQPQRSSLKATEESPQARPVPKGAPQLVRRGHGQRLAVKHYEEGLTKKQFKTRCRNEPDLAECFGLFDFFNLAVVEPIVKLSAERSVWHRMALAGPMTKERGSMSRKLGKWGDKRYFVVKDCFLGYSKKPNGELIRVIPLYGASIKPSISEKKFAFTIIAPFFRRKFILPTAEQAQLWVHALRNMLKDKHRFKSFAPPRQNVSVRPFMNGKEYFDALIPALLRCKRRLLISGWYLSPGLLLKRGAGIDPETLDRFRLDSMIMDAANRGVDVYILIYAAPSFTDFDLQPTYVCNFFNNLHPNIHALMHPNYYVPSMWSHHQKLVVCDETITFIGGIDLSYGRYEDSDYSITDVDEVKYPGRDYCNVFLENESNGPSEQAVVDRAVQPRMPWSDVQVQLDGMAAFDVALNFMQRWNHIVREGTWECKPMPFLFPSHSVCDEDQKLGTVDATTGQPFPPPTTVAMGAVGSAVTTAAADHASTVPPFHEPTVLTPQAQGSQASIGSALAGTTGATTKSASETATSTEPKHDPSTVSTAIEDPSLKPVVDNTLLAPGTETLASRSAAAANPSPSASPTSKLEDPAMESSNGGDEKALELQRTEADPDSPTNPEGTSDLVIGGNPLTMEEDPVSGKIVIGVAQPDSQTTDTETLSRTLASSLDSVDDTSGGFGQGHSEGEPYLENAHVEQQREQVPWDSRLVEENISLDEEDLGFPGCNVQIVRSVCTWSAGTSAPEQSIYKAYVNLIREAEHSIFIQNQYFITSIDRASPKNRLGEAIYLRVKQAIEQKQDFRVLVLVPVLPGGGAIEAASTRYMLKYTYRSISRGGRSIIEKLQQDFPDVDVHEYIKFGTPRQIGRLGNTLLSEPVYIHSKVMIVDDKRAIIGSANINDRSLRGTRDSEIACVIEPGTLASRMNITVNKTSTYEACKPVHQLRVRMWADMVGLKMHSARAKDLEMLSVLRDPIAGLDILMHRAELNTKAYLRVFPGMIPNVIHRIADFKRATVSIGPEEDPVVREQRLEDMKQIRGIITSWPFDFMKDEPIVIGVFEKEYMIPRVIFL